METNYLQGGEASLQEMKDFWVKFANYINGVQEILAENELLHKRVENLEDSFAQSEEKNAKLENENSQLKSENARLANENSKLEVAYENLKNDPWTSRVTYENTVDQIASFEDASKRDDARKVIEPMLKKSQVAQLRRDIKKRVKELNEESGNTFNNYGIYNEVQSGGININNMKDGGY